MNERWPLPENTRSVRREASTRSGWSNLRWYTRACRGYTSCAHCSAALTVSSPWRRERRSRRPVASSSTSCTAKCWLPVLAAVISPLPSIGSRAAWDFLFVSLFHTLDAYEQDGDAYIKGAAAWTSKTPSMQTLASCEMTTLSSP